MSLTLDHIQNSLPESKLRHGAHWLFSPEPLKLSKGEARRMTSLGHPLAQFQRASESIYQRSASGKLPSWITDVLDAGKPDWIVQQQRDASLRDNIPRVIRPDLILTEDGFALTELDSIPGGMGLTTWLSQVYDDAGFEVLGGRNGIPEGFAKLLPDGGQILISEESADYKPEMQWLAEQAPVDVSVKDVEEHSGAADQNSYRFFEWFDWENIPAAKDLATSANLTPPCKPHLEEKLWLALLWSPALKKTWEQELRGKHLQRIKEIVPHSWVTDPAPLPPHAAIPRLGVHSWEEVAQFSQSQRRLVLKISGFNELAWGSRGVKIGHDMPGNEWSDAIHHATEHFDKEPWVLQDYIAGRVIQHPYFDPDTGETKLMKGRVRICPYFFTDKSGYTSFGGALATIVPADKKKIHGMKDGILVPVMIG